MHGAAREIRGFVCRWCLLVLSSTGVLGTGWMSAQWAASMRPVLSGDLVAPDSVLRAGKAQAPLVGRASPVTVNKHAERVLCANRVGGITVAPSYLERVYPVALGAQEGTNLVLVKGVPYSGLAFKQDRPILLCIQPGRTVYLVDARLVLDAPKGNASDAAEVISRLRAAGQVALFHAGEIARYAEVREQCHRLFPGIPVLGHVPEVPGTSPPAVVVLLEAADRLKGPGEQGTIRPAGPTASRPTLPRGMPQVITADPDLALVASRSHSRLMQVHLVGATDGRSYAGRGLLVHESLSKLKEFAASEPIHRSLALTGNERDFRD